MPNFHTPLAVNKVPAERKILELAEMTSYVFDCPNVMGLKMQLQKDAESYRDWLNWQQDQTDEAALASLEQDEQGYQRVAYGLGAQRSLPGAESLVFLFSLVFTCPQILRQPAGFEWVTQDLEKVLFARRLDPQFDDLVATALNKARTRSRVGPPKDKALDYFRYATITQLMNPSEVIPGVAQRKLGKTKAVEFVSELEVRHFDGEGGVKSIWTSYKRVAQFLQQLAGRVGVQSPPASPPTQAVAGEPLHHPRQSRRSSRQTRTRRT